MTMEQEQLLIDLIKNDGTYQELLQECGELEKDYLRILATLRENDREVLDRYIGVCEELEHQKVRLVFGIK